MGYFFLKSHAYGKYLTQRDDLTLVLQKQLAGQARRKQLVYFDFRLLVPARLTAHMLSSSVPDGRFQGTTVQAKVGSVESGLVLGIIDDDSETVRTGVPSTRWLLVTVGKHVMFCPAASGDFRAFTAMPDNSIVMVQRSDDSAAQKCTLKEYP